MKTYNIQFIAMEQTLPESIVPCGECNSCCKLSPLLTPEEFESGLYAYTLMKTEYSDGPVVTVPRNENGCMYLINGKCSIYDTRPKACRVFDCRTSTFEKYQNIALEKFGNGV